MELEHVCEIFHADWPLVRQWGVRCSICGLFASCLDEQEAEDCLKAHLHRNSQTKSLTGFNTSSRSEP